MINNDMINDLYDLKDLCERNKESCAFVLDSSDEDPAKWTVTFKRSGGTCPATKIVDDMNRAIKKVYG